MSLARSDFQTVSMPRCGHRWPSENEDAVSGFDQRVLGKSCRVNHKPQFFLRLIKSFVPIENDPVEQLDRRSARPDFLFKSLPAFAGMADRVEPADGKQVRSDAARGKDGRFFSARHFNDMIEKFISRRADETVFDNERIIAIGLGNDVSQGVAAPGHRAKGD